MQTPTLSIPTLSAADKFRFSKKVNKNGPQMPHMQTPCWVWTAVKGGDGYGQFKLCGVMRRAHRIAFILNGGAFTEEKPQCLHLCDNRICCNPSHLFAGDNQENVWDKEAKARGNQPQGDAHYSRKNPEKLSRGESHPRAKLSDDQCQYIRASKLSGAAIARELGVHKSLISRIRGGQRRRTIPPTEGPPLVLAGE